MQDDQLFFSDRTKTKYLYDYSCSISSHSQMSFAWGVLLERYSNNKKIQTFNIGFPILSACIFVLSIISAFDIYCRPNLHLEFKLIYFDLIYL